MSKIQKELCEVLEISERKIGDDRQEFLNKMVDEVAKLSEKDWESLSAKTQDWYNEAADARNANQRSLPDFPDFEAPKPAEEGTSRRRASSKDDAKADAPTGTVEVSAKDLKKGMAVRLLTKRGKDVSGHVIEVDKEVLVIKEGDEEVEYDLERLDKIFTLETEKPEGTSRRRKSADEDEGPADPLVKGAKVTLTTKRGKTVTGKIVEIDDEVVVINDGKEEVEYGRDRVESIVPEAAAAEGTSRRRASGKDDGGDGKEDEGKGKRASNGGVSVGARIRELILDDLDATEEQIGKLLKKEDIEFRENTLKLNYNDTHKFLEILKKRKMLKV